MKIPKQFQLAGRTIKVEWHDKLTFKENFKGASLYREDKIQIQPSTKTYPITKQDLEHTYCHELVHWILHIMGKNELNNNEEFVDLFGAFLHQALTTQK